MFVSDFIFVAPSVGQSFCRLQNGTGGGISIHHSRHLHFSVNKAVPPLSPAALGAVSEVASHFLLLEGRTRIPGKMKRRSPEGKRRNKDNTS